MTHRKKRYIHALLFLAMAIFLTACVDSKTEAEPLTAILDEEEGIVYQSSLPQEQCYLCGADTTNLMSLYWGQDNIGFINLNTFEFTIFEINRYDEYGDLITEKAGYASMRGTANNGGSRYWGFSDSDRGIASGTVKLFDDSRLDMDKVKAFLCTDCLNKVMDKYLSSDEYLDAAIINFKTKEIRPLQKSFLGFNVGDFYISSVYSQNETAATEQFHLTAFYCPVRYDD